MQISLPTIHVLHGDTTEVLKRLIRKEEHISRYATIITSPPYYKHRKYGNDDREIGRENSDEEYIDKLTEIFKTCRKLLTKDGSLWIVIGDSKKNAGKLNIPHRLAMRLVKEDLKLRDDIVWFKRNHVLGGGKHGLTSAYEFILFFSKGEKCKVDHILKNMSSNYSNFWDLPTLAHKGEQHYAMYPETLVRRIISISTEVGDYVLDPFSGRGTTGMVCAENGRNYLGIDLYEYRSPKTKLFEF